MKTTLLSFSFVGAFMSLLVTSLPGQQREADPQPWQSSWDAFVAEMGRILGSAKSPTESSLTGGLTENLVLTGQEGEKRWVIDFSALPGSPQGDLNSTFGGMSVTWTLVVKEVQKSAEEVSVTFEKPKLAAPPGNAAFYEDITVISATLLDAAKADFAQGQTVTVTGTIVPPSAKDNYSGVTYLYGLGPNTGSRRIAVFLAKAEISATK